MPAARDPIGVLDSGLGGLSVLKALREELPNEQFLYCADCAHTPWGDKPESFIVERTRAIVHFLLEKRAKAIVLACNTATAAAADILRRELSVPIIGIEPAVKPAAAHTRTGVIGVIATRRTTESARYLSLLKRFAGNVKVVTVAAPGLMECVERGDFNSETTRELLLKYLTPIKAAGADKLVLGCTHYPFLSEAISEIMESHNRVFPYRSAQAFPAARHTALRSQLPPQVDCIRAQPLHQLLPCLRGRSQSQADV